MEDSERLNRKKKSYGSISYDHATDTTIHSAISESVSYSSSSSIASLGSTEGTGEGPMNSAVDTEDRDQRVTPVKLKGKGKARLGSTSNAAPPKTLNVISGTSATPILANGADPIPETWRRRWPGIPSRFPPISYQLENKGSVARDHLANERTYLAWLRTSLSLTSIGVAITQLFRLSSSLYTIPTNPSPSPSPSSSTEPTPSSEVEAALATLSAMILIQASELARLSGVVAEGSKSYAHLGKPVGGLFIMLGVTMLALGTSRYFRVQYYLTKNEFPPARFSVIFTCVMIGVSVLAAFAAIIAFR